MKTPAALALLLFLTACAAPGPYAYATPAPGEAAFLASGTMTAVATYDYATRVEYTRQAVAFSDATAQAVYATQAAAGATQAAATATAQTREAATAAAATVTAQAVQATQAAVAMQTRDAGWEATRRTALETQATATALTGAAEQDRQERTRGALWGWLGLLTVAGFVGVGLYTLYSFAVRRVSEARIIRNDRTGAPVALWIGRGMWEPIAEPLPALPAPNGNGAEQYAPPDITRMYGVRRERLFQADDDVALHWNGMTTVFTQAQIRQLQRWYQEGHKTVRRDTSSMGPGFDRLPVANGSSSMGSGGAYNTTRAILIGLGYITESGDWTPHGVEFFKLSRGGVVRGPSSSSSRVQNGEDDAHNAGWGS